MYRGNYKGIIQAPGPRNCLFLLKSENFSQILEFTVSGPGPGLIYGHYTSLIQIYTVPRCAAHMATFITSTEEIPIVHTREEQFEYRIFCSFEDNFMKASKETLESVNKVKHCVDQSQIGKYRGWLSSTNASYTATITNCKTTTATAEISLSSRKTVTCRCRFSNPR